jgi:hypothetical protein
VNVEAILELAAETLGDAGEALSTDMLRDKIGREVQSSIDKLEVLLSLDKRFVRGAQGAWQLSAGPVSEGGSARLVEQALLMQDRAEEALLNEQHAIKTRLSEIQLQLAEIDANLGRLGHQLAADATHVPSGEAQEYTLEYHFRLLSQAMRPLALQVHQAILNLPGTRGAYNKSHIAYAANRRFAMLFCRRSKLDIMVKAGTGFEDPEGWTRDATGRRLGLERIFSLQSADRVEYAMFLVQEAYDLVSERRS